MRVKYAFIYKVGLRFPYIKIRQKSFKAMGWSIGENVYFPADITIPVAFNGNSGDLKLGDRVLNGPRVTLVVNAHPNSSKLRNLFHKKESRITINNDAWLGAGVIVLQELPLENMP